MKKAISKIFRILLLFLIGYILIGIAIVLVEERISVLQDEAELVEFEQVDSLK